MSLITMSMSVLLAVPCSAQLVFDDGLPHLLEDGTNEQVFVTNGSHLILTGELGFVSFEEPTLTVEDSSVDWSGPPVGLNAPAIVERSELVVEVSSINTSFDATINADASRIEFDVDRIKST